MKILWISNPIGQSALRNQIAKLRDQGHELTFESETTAVMELLKDKNFDLILLEPEYVSSNNGMAPKEDSTQPEIHAGINLAVAIKNLKLNTKLVVLSYYKINAQTMTDTGLENLADLHNFIGKPCDTDTLAKALEV